MRKFRPEKILWRFVFVEFTLFWKVWCLWQCVVSRLLDVSVLSCRCFCFSIGQFCFVSALAANDYFFSVSNCRTHKKHDASIFASVASLMLANLTASRLALKIRKVSSRLCCASWQRKKNRQIRILCLRVVFWFGCVSYAFSPQVIDVGDLIGAIFPSGKIATSSDDESHRSRRRDERAEQTLSAEHTAIRSKQLRCAYQSDNNVWLRSKRLRCVFVFVSAFLRYRIFQQRNRVVAKIENDRRSQCKHWWNHSWRNRESNGVNFVACIGKSSAWQNTSKFHNIGKKSDCMHVCWSFERDQLFRLSVSFAFVHADALMFDKLCYFKRNWIWNYCRNYCRIYRRNYRRNYRGNYCRNYDRDRTKYTNSDTYTNDNLEEDLRRDQLRLMRWQHCKTAVVRVLQWQVPDRHNSMR